MKLENFLALNHDVLSIVDDAVFSDEILNGTDKFELRVTVSEDKVPLYGEDEEELFDAYELALVLSQCSGTHRISAMYVFEYNSIVFGGITERCEYEVSKNSTVVDYSAWFDTKGLHLGMECDKGALIAKDFFEQTQPLIERLE
jgi:hypothetical protein